MLRILAALLLLSAPALAQSGLGLPLDSRGGQLPTVTRSQAWQAPQFLPPQTLIDGSTVAVPPGSGSYFLTLTGTGHTIACPAGGLANVRWLTFDLTQGAGGPAGGYQVVWDTCYGFPAFTPPILTRDTGAVDSVSCYSVPASYGTLRCTAALNIGYGFLVRNNHVTPTGCVSTATCAVTIANSVTGDFRVIGLFWGGGGSGNPLAADVVSLQDDHGNNCSEATGAFGTIPAGTRATDIWYCQIFTGASSSTVTVTWGTNVPSVARIFAVEVAGAATSSVDAGLGNHNNGTGTALSVASNGNMPQPDNFVFALFESEGAGGGGLTVGANTTLLNAPSDSNAIIDAYQIPATSGGVATLNANTVGSQPWTASVAVFKHK